MTITFKRAVREDVPLLIGLTGKPGGGKTYSALRIAAGISNGKRFLGIDTERKRMSHYADDFEFDVYDMAPPYRPSRFVEIIRAGDAAGYPAIVIDSWTHEWNGEGGVLEWHDEIALRMATRAAGGKEPNFGQIEAMNFPAWREPKTDHNDAVEALLNIRAPLIFCMRGKAPLKPGVDPQTKKKALIEGEFAPVTSDDFPYLLTANLIVSNKAPGCVDLSQPNKISAPFKPFLKDGMQLDEAFGAKAAAWARGGGKPAAAAPAAGATDAPRMNARELLEATYGRVDAAETAAELDEILADPVVAKLRDYLRERDDPKPAKDFEAHVVNVRHHLSAAAPA